MRADRWCLFVLGVSAVAGCTQPVSSPPCSRDADCPAGRFCGPDEMCISECVLSSDCTGGGTCDARGRCVSESVDAGRDAGPDAPGPGLDAPAGLDAPSGDDVSTLADGPSSIDALVTADAPSGTDAPAAPDAPPPDAPPPPIPEWHIEEGVTNTGDERFYSVARHSSGRISAVGEARGSISPFGVVVGSPPALMAVGVDAAGSVLWSQTLDGSGTFDIGFASAVGADGTTYVGGSFSGMGNFVPGGGATSGGPSITSDGRADGIVAAFDASGNWLWQQVLAGNAAGESDYVRALAVDPDGLRLVSAGWFYGTVTVGTAMHTSGGTAPGALVVWHDLAGSGAALRSVAITNSASQAKGVVVAGDGTVFVTGAHAGPTSFGGSLTGDPGTNANGFVAAFTRGGLGAGAMTVAGSGHQEGTAIALAPDGDVIVGGYYEGALTLGTASLPAPPTPRAVWVARIAWGTPPTVEWLSRVVGATSVVDLDALDVAPDGRVLVSVSGASALTYSRVAPTASAATSLLPAHGTAVDAVLVVLDAAGGHVSHRRVGPASGGDMSMVARISGIEAYSDLRALLVGITSREIDAWGVATRATDAEPFIWHAAY